MADAEGGLQPVSRWEVTASPERRRRGRQADRRWQMQLGVDWVQLAAGTRVPPPDQRNSYCTSVAAAPRAHKKRDLFFKKKI